MPSTLALETWTSRLAQQTNVISVMGKILLLKYLKYFTKYSGKKVFKIVF